MALPKSPLRQEFEVARRREAFFTFLAAAMTGIIVSDTWVSHWLGVPGGLLIGGIGYGMVYGYETLMWRRHHGR
jgi:hypothetical protein